MTGPKDRYQPWDAPEILVRAGGACWQWLRGGSASLSSHWVSHRSLGSTPWVSHRGWNPGVSREHLLSPVGARTPALELGSSMSLTSICQVFQWCWNSRVPGDHPPGLSPVSSGSTHWVLWDPQLCSTPCHTHVPRVCASRHLQHCILKVIPGL